MGIQSINQPTNPSSSLWLWKTVGSQNLKFTWLCTFVANRINKSLALATEFVVFLLFVCLHCIFMPQITWKRREIEINFY